MSDCRRSEKAMWRGHFIRKRAVKAFQGKAAHCISSFFGFTWPRLARLSLALLCLPFVSLCLCLSLVAYAPLLLSFFLIRRQTWLRPYLDTFPCRCFQDNSTTLFKGPNCSPRGNVSLASVQRFPLSPSLLSVFVPLSSSFGRTYTHRSNPTHALSLTQKKTYPPHLIPTMLSYGSIAVALVQRRVMVVQGQS